MEALGMVVLVVGLVSMDAPLYLKMMTRTTTIITMLITITMTKTLRMTMPKLMNITSIRESRNVKLFHKKSSASGSGGIHSHIQLM